MFVLSIFYFDKYIQVNKYLNTQKNIHVVLAVNEPNRVGLNLINEI